jgi:hypothetical protein
MMLWPLSMLAKTLLSGIEHSGVFDRVKVAPLAADGHVVPNVHSLTEACPPVSCKLTPLKPTPPLPKMHDWAKSTPCASTVTLSVKNTYVNKAFPFSLTFIVAMDVPPQLGATGNPGSPLMCTFCPGCTCKCKVVCTSPASVTAYVPAAPESTAEIKLAESCPRYPPSLATPAQLYNPCATLQLNLVSVPSIVANSS